MALDLEHLHRVHCLGVGGIGVSAVAKLLRLQGKEVSGSDLHRSPLTEDAERAGVVVKDEDPANVTPDLDLLIYTPAATDSHPERRAAAALGIPQFSYPEFLGLLSRSRETVAVSGTNGKSTTTAMLGLILEAAGLDPLVIVGSRVPGFPYGNLRLGKGRIFVVEACEYRAGLLDIEPVHAVITNVAHDHPDYFRDLAHVRKTFKAFAAKLPPQGTLVLNADDAGSRGLTGRASRTFGFSEEADYRVTRHGVAPGEQRFDLVRKEPEERWNALTLRIPGRFNVENALAAAAMARELGVDPAVIKRTLAEYAGIWRRFERLGRTPEGAEVVSDYGHHPDAVRGTLAAAREFFPDKRLILVFQPHHHERTRRLFDAFVESFDGADVLVLAEIYGVEGRKEGADRISSRTLAEAVRARGRVPEVRYAADLDEAARLARPFSAEDAIMLVMGAGDIYTIAPTLCRNRT
jgi:UDP-N-acetylmuramate--alanine ligase